MRPRARSSTAASVSPGVSSTRRQAFQPWIERGAFDIVQPDVTKVGGISEERRIFVYPEGDSILGYCYAASDSQDEGYIEFIGVDEAARGKGVGKRLLLTALHWLFAERNMPQVGLTVLDYRTNAQKLYESVG